MDPTTQGAILLLEAEQYEASGDMENAVRCYKEAFKLCPELEAQRPKDDADVEMDYTRLPQAGSGFQSFPAVDLLKDDSRQILQQYFDEYGFIVLDEVMSEDEVLKAKQHFKTFMSAAGIDIDDEEEIAASFGDRAVGIVGKCGAGQSAMNWFVRSRPLVKEAFRFANQLKPNEKLITSFDGFNYFRNPETNPAWQGSITPWFHFDAGHKDHARYVQGIVNLMDCTDESDAGLVLLPKSHNTLFPHVVPQDPQYPSYLTYMGRREWLTAAQLGIAERPFRVPLKAGSIVLWKSSVMHCNSSCLPRSGSRANPGQLIRRLAVYVCMMKDPMDSKLTEQRRRYFAEGRTTGHQPDILRGTGDFGKREFISAGAIIVDEAQLPEGATELL